MRQDKLNRNTENLNPGNNEVHTAELNNDDKPIKIEKKNRGTEQSPNGV